MSSEPSSSSSPSRPSTSHRLLYRGSISLPDSYLLLDGLTFSASIDSNTSTPNTSALLDNPLALALETMRGRPSLRLISTVKVAEVWTDDSPCVYLDIHPSATLSRMYFENMFCLTPFPTRSQTSEYGIKVALGDTDGPETTYILICARMASKPSPSPLPLDKLQPGPPAIELVAARLTTIAPASAAARIPRPDDPTPRKPPELIRRVLDRENGKSSSSLVRKAPVGRSKSSLGLVNIADVPPPQPVNGKGKAKEVDSGAKRKQPSYDDEEEGPESQLERANKNVIKQATSTALTSPPSKLRKSDAEFKEVYSWVYRGVCFALRRQMKTSAVDLTSVERLVRSHVSMYVDTGKKKGK